jgi:hypothetical protein
VCGLSDGGRSFGTNFGKWMIQHGKDVGDEIRAFEPAQRANGEPNRLWVAAPETRTDGRKISGRRGTPVLRDHDGQATRRNSDR